ncbi:helix-turn-helix domain-containing protein [Clostridium cellulovorans]|uniref:Helix-turn-helix domain protein n=1 Tax=Clostridium cellulovorans (strain ATCC 35296 / DSM 3052 / OCM 3 / 743B) TaxID=573061 RepID=D9SSU4_CLOC7|nr:helix-turn-helix transcriptional regulator [Clostridium cellulovorans]ADL52606.1 helix-turn-helix domain protein [Clostridium cellulovorans 743B]
MEILSLGEKIKRLRKEKGFTLKDLAGDRITPGQISLVESGKSNPSMDLLEYLANTLHCTVEYLMESEETQAEKICIYYENIAESHIIEKQWGLAEENIEKSSYYAEKYKLEYRKAKIYYLKGDIEAEKGNLQKAQEYFLISNGIFTKEKLFEEMVDTFLKLGDISYNLKAYHSAITYFQQAERIFTDNEVINDFLKGKIYHNLAKIHQIFDQTDKAINYTYLAKEKFKQLDNKRDYGNTLLLLAKEYLKNENLEYAIRYSNKALKTLDEARNLEYMGDIENNLGKLFYEFENIQESFDHYEKARELRNKYDKNKLIGTLINMCNNYVKLKDIENARKVLEEINENIEYISDLDMVQVYILNFRLFHMENNDVYAEKNLLIALNYAESKELYKEAAQLSFKIGNFYLDKGDEKMANQYLNKGVELFRSLGILQDI